MITLHPSNWLYNAGVVGLLRVLENSGNIQLTDGGTANIDLTPVISRTVSFDANRKKFEIPELVKWYFEKSYEVLVDEKDNPNIAEVIKSVWGKLFNTYYRGFFNANTRYLYAPSKRSPALIQQFSDFVKGCLTKSVHTNLRCVICCSQDNNFSYKNKFTSEHSKILGASEGEFPNAFWFCSENTSLLICDLCSFILLNSHLALTPLADQHEIFVNAPSFKIMYYLNKLMKEVYENKEAKHSRELLGISLIEMATRLNVQLGVWTMMNIEVVSKYKNRIDFFSLPYEIVKLLIDHEIASILKDIGELKVLNMVLNGDFKKILSFGEKVMRIGLKPKEELNKAEKDFINEEIKLERNRKDLIEFSQKLFSLYVSLSEKSYDHSKLKEE